MLKKVKWQELVVALVFIACGVLILLKSDTTAMIIAKFAGYFLIAAGAAFVIAYFVRRSAPPTGNDLAIGLIIACIGIFFVLKTETVSEVIPTILGIFIAISGILKLQKSLNIHRMGFPAWINVMILALIDIVIGLLVVLEPFTSVLWMMRLIAIGMIYSGVTDFISTFFIAGKYKDFMANGKGGKSAAERGKEPAETGKAARANVTEEDMPQQASAPEMPADGAETAEDKTENK